MIRVLVKALAFAAVTAFGTSGAVSAQDIKVGAILPLTGDLQAFGKTSIEGVKLAVQEINAQGGVLGEELGLVTADTRTSPQAGVDAAKKLVEVENVAGIVGAMSSGVTIPIAKNVASRGTPQISNASTSPVITNLDDNGYLFRTIPSDKLQGLVLGEIVKDQGVDSVATLYVNNDYGEGLADVFKTTFEELGGTVHGNLPYEKGKASYRGELRQLAENDPKALLLIAYPENGVTILRQAIEGGYFDRFVLTDGMKAPEVVEAIGGEYLKTAIGSTPSSFDTAGAAYFKQAYEKEFGELPPKPFIDTAYDATYLLALAIEQAGSTDSSAVRDALHEVANPPGTEIGPGEWEKAVEALGNGEEINYEGAAGPHDFNENGDVPGVIEHWTFTADAEVKTVRKVEK